MENHFGFLAQAKPAGLYRLLEKLPLEDAAIALAGLPAGVGVQVMAYYPENLQGELMPAMREARRVAPERAKQTAARIRNLLVAAKYARDNQTEAATPAPSAAPVPPKAEPPRPAAAPAREPPGAVAPKSAAQRAAAYGKPAPWVPRTTTESAINGPAMPGKPPPVAGDPFTSPLAKAGLMDLIARAQNKLLPKRNPPAKPAAPAKPSPAGGAGAGKRPAAREGVVRSVEVGKTPRVIGPGGKAAPGAPAAGGGRRMDGKAILAAILREAGPEIRDSVQHDDPALFRELRGRMFYFDDLIYTEDSALARVFTAAPAEESALALKFAAPALRDRVLRVVSPGRAEALRQTAARRAGLDAVEAAQKKVLDVALQLQAAGRILIDPRDPDLAR